MKNYLADYDLIAVSANLKETAINTEQTIDTSMLVNKSTIISLDPRRENNANELTGKEEPDAVYDLGSLSVAPLNFDKAQAQHFAFAYAFGLGLSTPAAWGTGYQHVILPLPGMDQPRFTAIQRFGSTIFKRRFASLVVDTIKSTFAKDSWAKLEIGAKGTGKFTDNMVEETVNAAYNATSLALAALAVQGGDAATRLDNVHRIRVQVPTTGEWKEVVFSAVSGATPAIITIAAPGGAATLCDYKITYVPTEAAWCTFPARVSEPPLRVTDLVVKIGGKWDGSDFLGGRTLSSEIESIEHNITNQMNIEFRVGGTGNYANSIRRDGRQQTLVLNQEMRDFVLEQHRVSNETFGVSLKATGAEFETGKNYYVEMIFPKCGVLKNTLSVNGKVLAQAGDLTVLEDDTYGSIRVKVGNKVAAYAG
jgi:hypothetical protein